MRPKIPENLRTANFNQKFTGYKKKSNWHWNVCRFLGFCSAAISYFNLKTDWYFFQNAVNQK